jgi:uncharacterized BrkB/YihY/UPF0761 family membrane protein
LPDAADGNAVAVAAAPRLRWWRELLYIAAFYGVYTLVRNRGLDPDVHTQAFHNAKRVIAVERLLGTFHERFVQHLFLGWRWFIRFWDVYYGTFHFVITVFALIWLFRRMPERYPQWRNTLACTTALALLGFAFFPLMPPRLLETVAGSHYGFVDTLQKYGGLWSFDSGTMQKLSNQYAAMPSLHFAWSTWSALVLLPGVRRPWLRALLVAYPFATLFAIVVTANHYWIDAAGGAVVLAVGYSIGRFGTPLFNARLSQSKAPAGAVTE